MFNQERKESSDGYPKGSTCHEDTADRWTWNDTKTCCWDRCWFQTVCDTEEDGRDLD
jgi:hypothetical protein